MRAVVIYESMYGNTHLIAESIADGLRQAADATDATDVTVVPVGTATAEVLADVDLVVVGGPTHAHGMSRPATRESAADAVDRSSDTGLVLDPAAEGPGVRDWLEGLDLPPGKAAAFDTRVDMPAILSGRASKGIAKALHHHGWTLVVEPESFLVTKDSVLEPGEAERARAWGATLSELPTART